MSLRGQVIVDTDFTVTELVRDILVSNGCAETSNYKSYTGANVGVNGIAYFDAKNSDFPFEEGIILSTGRATDAAGPNIDIKGIGTPFWQGDEDLSNITKTSNLFNASYIEFDFVPSTNRISFNFLFASEEYFDNFQCSYSDVFAFILTDTSGNSTNLAIVPGTNEPVSVVNIRPGTNDCSPKNVTFFNGINGVNSDVSFHGMTKRLQAVSDVNSGELYNIKLVIADNQDFLYDSAVFLEAGSFKADFDLGQDYSVLNGNPLCIGEELELDAAVSDAIGYKWFRGTTELTAFENLTQIKVTESGTYMVEVSFSALCSETEDVIADFIEPPIIAETPLNLTVCDINDGNQITFDFTENGNRILGNQDPEIYEVNYYYNMQDAALFLNKIDNVTAFQSTSSSDIIFARISSGRSCYEIASFEIDVRNLDVGSNTIQESYLICRDENSNIIGTPPTITTSLPETEYHFSWYLNTTGEENKITGETNSAFIPVQPGVYFIEIENILFGCSFTFSTEVIAIDPPIVFEIDLLTDPFSGSNDIEVIVEGNSNYLLSLDGSSFNEESIFKNLLPGEHIVQVTDINECTLKSLTFEVIDYPRFFTPNGDQINDEWKIISGETLENVRVAIFNRLGQLLCTLSPDDSWDGTTQGSALPSSDYWFSVTYEKDGIEKVFKSHFTLKR